MARKLKVFRTAIGFHDAYVAAPSQKAALEAWGADANLFSRGAAELVVDEALSAEPLAYPGKIVKRLRATEAEHLAALESDAKALKGPLAKSPKPVKRKPQPRPDRQPLEEAEGAVSAAEREAEQVSKSFRERERQLAAERRATERAAQDKLENARSNRDAERARYERALARWRA